MALAQVFALQPKYGDDIAELAPSLASNLADVSAALAEGRAAAALRRGRSRPAEPHRCASQPSPRAVFGRGTEAAAPQLTCWGAGLLGLEEQEKPMSRCEKVAM